MEIDILHIDTIAEEEVDQQPPLSERERIPTT
jgi:hypothetical protein